MREIKLSDQGPNLFVKDKQFAAGIDRMAKTYREAGTLLLQLVQYTKPCSSSISADNGPLDFYEASLYVHWWEKTEVLESHQLSPDVEPHHLHHSILRAIGSPPPKIQPLR